ncbi:MAG: chemotaxis protein CheW [Desulfobacteraceae bacterium]|nr:chemotaxis protein CheW [Desulfobacteraceae bacterium]
MECFTFKAADKYLGIEARHIHRVVDEATITPVPLLPLCHLGLLYVRGELFDVIDIGHLLGQEKGSKPSADRENYRAILLKWSQGKLALVPDEIIGITWIEDNNGEEGVYFQEGYKIQVITPEHIWEMLSGFSYGYRKI